MPYDEHDQAEATAIHKKLDLRPGLAGVVVAPPEDDANPLLPLPEGVISLAGAEEFGNLPEPVPFIIFFARNRAEFTREFAQLRDKMAPGGALWISWIKQTAARGGGGMPGDLNENVIRRIALSGGLVDVKVASLDHEWSALKLVRRKR